MTTFWRAAALREIRYTEPPSAEGLQPTVHTAAIIAATRYRGERARS